MFFNENKQTKKKRLHSNNVQIPRGLGRDTNMAAFSLFGKPTWWP